MAASKKLYGSSVPSSAEADAGVAGAREAACALDCMAHGVIVTDHRSRPRFVNRTAAEILKSADGLSVTCIGLVAANSAETLAIRAAVAAMSEHGEHAPVVLTISRPSMRRRLIAFVLPGQQTRSGPGCGSALLFIRDPDRSRVPPAMVLRQLYDLTPAEAETAVRVARGHGLPIVAKALEVRLTTARSHLQHVFAKTGTRRQAELAWLLAETCGLLQFGSGSRWQGHF